MHQYLIKHMKNIMPITQEKLATTFFIANALNLVLNPSQKNP
jgi:hypothetical protein